MELLLLTLLAGLIGYIVGREKAVDSVRRWYAERRGGEKSSEGEDSLSEQ